MTGGRVIRRVVAVAAVLAAACVGYAAITPLPRAEPRFVTPEWIGPTNVVNVGSGNVAYGQAIEFRGGRIVRIVPVGQIDHQVRAKLYDVHGGYVTPGLWDMHAVLTRYGDFLEQPLNLAHGIVRVRSILNCPSEAATGLYACRSHKRQWNAEIHAGQLLGAITMGSGSFPILPPDRRHADAPDNFAPSTPWQARDLVRAFARERQSENHLKTYDGISREVFFALMAEARARGVEVSGHVPITVTTIEASNAGFKAIAHARILPIACSSQETKIGRMRSMRAAATDWMRLALETYDPARCAAVWRTLIRNGTFLSPTLITRFSETKGGIARLADAATAAVTPGVFKLLWQEDVAAINARSASEDEIYRRYYVAAAKRTVEAERAGVKLLIGSDTNDPWVAPGIGFHVELGLWRRAGMSTPAILRAATINAANYYNAGAMGRIAPGYVGDLVITTKNPLVDPSVLRRPNAVMQEGRLYSRGTLDAAVANAERIASGPRFPVRFLIDLLCNPFGFAE